MPKRKTAHRFRTQGSRSSRTYLLSPVAVFLILALPLLPTATATTSTVVISMSAPYSGGVSFSVSRHFVSGCGGSASVPHHPSFNRTVGIERWAESSLVGCGAGWSVKWVWAGVHDLNFSVAANGTYFQRVNLKLIGALDYNLSGNGSSSGNSSAGYHILTSICIEDLTQGGFYSGVGVQGILGSVSASGQGRLHFNWSATIHGGGVYLIIGHTYGFKVVFPSGVWASSSGGKASATLDLWSGRFGARLISDQLTQ
jgi:hypothetical protein